MAVSTTRHIMARSITISNMWTLLEEIKRDMKSKEFQAEGLSASDGFSNLTSHNLRSFFQKHKIDPKVEYRKYYSEDQAIIILTYEWTSSYQYLKQIFSEENIRRNCRTFNPDFSLAEYLWNFFLLWICFGQFSSPPIDINNCGIWMDIFFIDQNGKPEDLIKDVENSEYQYKNNRIHWIIDSETLFERCWCLHEISTRYLAGKHSRIIRLWGKEPNLSRQMQSLQNVETSKALMHHLNFLGFRNYFDQMKAFDDDDKAKLKEKILASYGSKWLFNFVLARKVSGSKVQFGLGIGSWICWGTLITILPTLPIIMSFFLFGCCKIIWRKCRGTAVQSSQLLRIHIAAGWYLGLLIWQILLIPVLCSFYCLAVCCACLCSLVLICCFKDRIERLLEQAQDTGESMLDQNQETRPELPQNMSMRTEMVVLRAVSSGEHC